MQTVKKTSPYIRKEVSTKRMMTDVIIALLPATIFAVYRFGSSALIRILVSIAVMVLFEAIGFAMMAKARKNDPFLIRIKTKFKNYRPLNVIIPILSGLIYGLIIPSELPLYAVIVGAIFGIVVAKMLFGGTGNNIFNVAAAGRAFIGLALTAQFTGTYVQTDLVSGATALSSFRGSVGFINTLDSYSIMDLFLGNIPGSMGEISALAILIGAIYLLVRHSADIRLILGSLIPFAVFMLIAGFAMYPTHAFEFLAFQMFSGGIMFGAVFMITDPVTAPVNGPGRITYGLLFATVTVLIRLFGAYPEGVVFSILFANVFVALIEYPKWSPHQFTIKYNLIYASVFTIISFVVFLSAGGFS